MIPSGCSKTEINKEFKRTSSGFVGRLLTDINEGLDILPSRSSPNHGLRHKRQLALPLQGRPQ